MVDAGGEVDLGRLEGVVGRKVDGQEEDAAGVRRVALRTSLSALTKGVQEVSGLNGSGTELNAGRGFAGSEGRTYGTHDRCLPVELFE